ncbi:PilN domain-containing protein [Patescibacteria group bacterium]|nr:PilN domain-containing protein [Patescibacteria group bacterium]
MLALNLISQEQKKEIKLKRAYEITKKVSCILIIIAIFIAVVLLIGKLILQMQFIKAVDQYTLVAKSSQGDNGKIRDINNSLNFVSEIQSDFIFWSNLIKDAAYRVPDGVSLSSINIDRDKKTIQIKGTAKLRDDLLQFKKNIEKSLIYQNVDLPLQNILQKENINFEIKAGLNLSEL